MGVNDAANILNSPNIVCQDCGGKVFQEGFALKKVSQFVSPTGKEMLYPIPVYYCVKCGSVPKDMMEKPNAKKIFGESVIDEA